jgi:polyferredoxin
MDKIGKPRGLIDYLALADEPEERAGKPPKPVWKHILRTRTVLYTTLWSLIGFGLVFALFIRADIDLTVDPVRNPQFIVMSDGSVRNTYTVRLRNKHGEPRDFRISLTADTILRIAQEGSDTNILTVAPDSTTQARVYVIARPQDPASSRASTDLRLWVEDVQSGERAHRDTIFNGRVQ